MTPRRIELAGAATIVTALTILVTWPQTRFLSTHVVAHHDPFLSIWRLGWIAHALQTAPSQLFNANIFYPARDTLAFSDATLLEGVLATPLLWLGAPPVLVYNLLLLAGFIGSGVAMFVLARHLTGSLVPALVAAAVFTMLPYRTEHVMHLELQWMMFVPLTWWALHRLVERGSWGWGVLAGLFFWLQVLACIYYGVFLAITLVVFVPALLVASPRIVASTRDGAAPRNTVSGALPGLAVALVVAALLTLPFALPYRAAAQDVGGRAMDDIARYSAMPVNYISTSALSWMWGWTADRWGGPELRLFPGLTALILAALAWTRRPRSLVIVYGLITAFAVEFSFGLNGPGYRSLIEHVNALQGFRSLARFAAIASCSLSVLVAYGMQALLSRRVTQVHRSWLIVALATLLIADYANHPINLTPGDPVSPPDAYKMLRRAEAGAVLELPLPRLDRLPGNEPLYEAWSLWHWKPLINGYSGYYPRDYLDTVFRMQTFPDADSIARLRAHNVRYVIVHRAFYDHESYTRLMLSLAVRPAFKPWGAYKDPVGTADIFELTPID